MEINYEQTIQNIEKLRTLISKKYNKELTELEKKENNFYEALGFDMLKRSINHKRKKIEIIYYFLNALEISIESQKIEKRIIENNQKLDSIIDFLFDFDFNTNDETQIIYTEYDNNDDEYTLGLDKNEI